MLDIDERQPVRTVRVVALIVAMAVCVAIMVIGVRFLVAPGAAAAGFGLRATPDDPFLAIKGVRDIASGLVVLVVLAVAGVRALGWALLAAATIPLGDMIVVLTRGGPVATALGVHGATCLVMVVAAATLLLGSRTTPGAALDGAGPSQARRGVRS